MTRHFPRWQTVVLGAALGIAAPPVRAGQPDAIFADGFEFLSFRFADLDLRDPHVWVDALGCHDFTDSTSLGFSFNGLLQTSIQTDGDNDGLLDLSYLLRLYPFNESDGAAGEADFVAANCSSPFPPAACAADGSVPVVSMYTSQTLGTCLAPLAGTTGSYTPAIVQSSAPCFWTSPQTVILDVAGIPITLQNAQLGATYVGNPATGLSNGLIAGFISEADADATILPSTLPLVGGLPLSSLFAGGTGSCPAFSDKDVIGGVTGWQVYFNFTAGKVNYGE